MAGFVYEALGERGLAAPGYRKAAELRPDTSLIEKSLINLDRPSTKANESDVLIVLQSGLAPARDSIRIPLLLTISDNTVITPLSFPVIKPDVHNATFTHVLINNRAHGLTLLNSVTTMSQRALRDDMPGVILRTSVRAITRGVAQKQLNEVNPLAGLALGLASAAIESADTRTWRTLADNTQVARIRLKHGEHQLRLPNIGGTVRVRIKADQRYQVITLRVVGQHIFSHDLAANAALIQP